MFLGQIMNFHTQHRYSVVTLSAAKGLAGAETLRCAQGDKRGQQ